jgi:Raf kinase inhibitor-like YbhB/YbcL family protein
MHPVEVLLLPVGWALRSRRPDEALSLARAPELQTGNRVALTSPSFAEGEVIPARHCGPFIGADISPALAWGPLPPETKSLVLLFEDIDNPAPVPGLHTIAAFAPAEGGLPEGALAPGRPGVQFLRTPRGRARYAGRRPVPGHGPHRYRFHLYALDTDLDLATVGDAARLPAALAGHVLASGTLTGIRTS